MLTTPLFEPAESCVTDGRPVVLRSEKDAATMCRTIVKVVGHCHSLKVMHR